jgi:hypothetical protein
VWTPPEPNFFRIIGATCGTTDFRAVGRRIGAAVVAAYTCRAVWSDTAGWSAGLERAATWIVEAVGGTLLCFGAFSYGWWWRVAFSKGISNAVYGVKLIRRTLLKTGQVERLTLRVWCRRRVAQGNNTN